MSVNCLIFYGDHVLPCLFKSAGPHRIATELRKNGYSVQLCDMTGIYSNHELINYTVNNLIDKNTLWVGISGTFMQHVFNVQFKKFNKITDPYLDNTDIIKNFMEMCRNKNPDIKFVFGGSKKFQLDNLGWYTFVGYSDYEIVEFTKWCENKNYKPHINRLGKIITCKEYNHFSTSYIKYEDNDLVSPGEVLPIEISRGCIFKCEFCAFPLNGKTKGEWIKKPDILRQELIENWEKYQIDTYNFTDDTYNDSPEKVRMYHDKVFTKLPFKLRFTSYIRLDLVMRNPETIELLKDSGLESAVTGIETLNIHSGKLIGKGVDPMKQLEFVSDLKSSLWKDVLISSGFILGLPKDTQKDLEFFEEFILGKNNPLDHWMVNPLGLFPPEINGHINWYSKIDKDHKSYGYELIGDAHKGGHFTQWVHKENGIDWELSNIIAKRVLHTSINKLKNYKIGGNFFWERLNMGIPREDLQKLSWSEIKQKYNIEHLKKQKRDDYYSRFLKIIKNHKT
jgi:hypothetical protein